MATATSVSQRVRGLVARRLGAEEALLLKPCKQVHTFGMVYPIDVVFCDGEWVVLRVLRGMKPRRVGPVVWRARCAIELNAGAAEQVHEGDRLAVVPSI